MATAAAAVAARSPAGGADGRGIRPGPRRPRPPTRREGAPPPAGRRFAAARPRLRGRRGGMGLRCSRPLSAPSSKRGPPGGKAGGRAGRPRLRVRVPRAITSRHPSFDSEWWYYTGNLSTGGGAAISASELTFFREGEGRSTLRSRPRGTSTRSGSRTSRSPSRHPRAALRRRRAGQPLRPGPRRRRRREAAESGTATGASSGGRAPKAGRAARAGPSRC